MSSVITNRETNEVLTSDPVDVGKYHVVYSFDAGKNYSAVARHREFLKVLFFIVGYADSGFVRAHLI